MNENELQPWIVVLGSPARNALAQNSLAEQSLAEQSLAEQSLALWRLSETDQPALALFTSAAQAERYALVNASAAWSVQQPARSALLRIMIECFRQDVQLAVLDPDQATARRIFNLRDVLRAARDELNAPL